MDIINIIFALASIGLGIFGWLAPQYTLDTLDLQAGPSGMGPSEIRASAGALFVGMGLGALILCHVGLLLAGGGCGAGDLAGA
jgi:hypothetical protein